MTRFSNKYEVISQLGHGSMGVVYKVRHTALDTILAIKVLSAHLTENAELVKRFYREARVMARLQHPNIARVIDVQHDEVLGVHYFIMEYIQGRTLKEYVRERGGSLGLYDVINVVRQVARALHYSHNFNPPVIHRDIKPTNIMVEQETQRVVVMDFGIAKELGESELTQAGAILGTFKYCPPEQMRHEPLDGGADVYALGMVMYEIYTGAHLFKGLNEGDVIRKVLESEEYEIRLPSATLPKFAATLSKAIKKDRNLRYRRMEDFLRDLDECWALLDESQPTVISSTRSIASTAQGEPEDLTQIEEQIEKLEEERQRRLTVKLQMQAQKSKEMAARESAAQLAGDLFQQGCSQEESGRTHLKERNYPLARLAYEQADKLFTEAREKAIAELLIKKAEELRAETLAARQEADRYSAKEKAGAYYGHALALQAQADDLWEHRSYHEAGQLYGQARDMFEDAHERAYRALIEEETKAAQSQIKPARDAAIGEQAEELASELFWDAVRNERRADTAFGQQEFTHSQELYRIALQKYQQARTSACGERQRRQSLTAREQAQAARREAEAQGANSEEAYRDALEEQRQGESWLKAQKHEQAAEAFSQAAADFGRACEDVARARQLQTLQSAREHMERLRTTGVPAEMQERFAARFARIERSLDEAVQSEHRQNLVKATQLYEAAAQDWAQLLHEANALAEREQAEALRARLSETLQTVAPLRAWASAAWKSADAQADQAEAAWQKQDYERAVRLYESALEAYATATSEADDEQQLERQALESRQQATEAEEAARQADAPHHARDLYKAGINALQKGEQALRAKYWSEASQHFTEVQTQLGKALQETQRARDRDAAGAAKQNARQAHNEALDADAKTFLPDAFAQASSLLKNAEEALSREDYQEARTLFDQSAALFRQVREDVARARQVQALQVAREHMERLRATDVPAGMQERFAARFAHIERSLDEAVQSEQRQDPVKATQLYEAAAQDWAQLLHEANVLAEREQAEVVRVRLSETLQTVAPLRAWALAAWKSADAQADQAEAAWQKQDYERAAELYESALAVYATAASKADEEQRLDRQALESQRQAAEAEEAARQADAPHYAKALYKAGVKALQKGEQAQRARHWTEATQHFTEAQAKLGEALRETQRARDGDAVEVAKQTAWQVHNEALEAAAEELFPDDFAQASSFLHDAEEALSRENVQQARTLFDQSATLFRQISEQTVLTKIQKAHTRAEMLRRETGALPRRRRLKQADKVLYQGEHLSEKGSYHEAIEKYNEAISLYSKSLQASAESSLRSKPLSPPARFLRYSILIMVVVLAVGIYYLLPGPKPSPKSPSIAITPKPQAPPQPTAPSISGATPAEHELTIAEGQSQRFSVTAEARQGPALRYEWYLDGKKKADGPLWTYQPGFAEADGNPKELKVVITDGANLTATRIWRVNVTNVNRQPHIESVSPENEALELSPGDVKDFSVSASDPDEKDQLTYRWFVDGHEVSKGQRWQYRAAAPEGRHTVSIEVADPGGLVNRKLWNVQVRAPEVVPMPPEISRASPELPPDQALTIREGDSQAFSADAKSPQGLSLQYAWFLDGKKKGEGPAWVYKPDMTEAETRPKEVELVVTDSNGLMAKKAWKVSVLDVGRPPQIVKFSPAGETIRLDVNETKTFSAEATDPDQGDKLAYLWWLDGKKAAEGSRWQFRAPTVAGNHKVELKISDQGGLTAARSWNVVIEAPLAKVDIVETTPSKERIVADAGEALTFAVTARLAGSPEAGAKNELKYQWTLNKEPPEITDTGEFRIDNLGPGKHRLTVVAISQAGLKSRPHQWVVDVKPAEPEIEAPEETKPEKPAKPDIVETTPGKEHIKSNAGELLTFTVTARLASGSEAGAKNELKYQWTLNDEPPEITDTGEFRVDNLGPGKHRLTVVVISQAGLKSRPRQWIVDVKPAKPKIEEPESRAPEDMRPKEPEIRKPEEARPKEPEIEEATKQAKLKEPAEASPKVPGITEAEVKAWLDSYQRAWQDKDIGTLVRLGEVKSQNAEKLRDVLEKYDKFRVSLQGVSIRIEGNEATVTFRRVDTINGTNLTQPDKKTVILGKERDGRLMRRFN